jgi:hypothetical protein
MIIVSSGTGTVTNINTTAPLSGGPITTSGTITTAMATNKLIGRSTAGTGTMEEITVGTGLSLTGGTLSSTGGATAAGNTNEIQFNNAAAFAASANLRWIIADNRFLLGTENTADINSRMVIIGKGISTNNTFVVHNSTGTNNSLVVRDDGFVGFGALPFTTGTNRYRFNLGTNANIGFSLPSAGVSRISAINDSLTNSELRLMGNPLILETAGVEYARVTDTEFRVQTVPLNINRSLNAGTEGELLNINKTDTNTDCTLSINFRSSTTAKYAGIKANNGTGSGTVNYMSFWVRNISNTFAEQLRLNGNGNLLLGTTSENAGSAKVLVINNGTAPSGNVTDSFQQYSADIVAGNAAPHFRTENGNVVKIYQETTGVGSATLVSGGGGSAKHDDTYDGYTLAQIVKALRNQGLLA